MLPSLRSPDLVELREYTINKHKIPVEYADVPQPGCMWYDGGPQFIVIPCNYIGPMSVVWALAHELSHIDLGHGFLGQHLDTSHEVEANHYASKILIPDPVLEWVGHHPKKIKEYLLGVYPSPSDLVERPRNLAYWIAYRRLEASRKKVA